MNWQQFLSLVIVLGVGVVFVWRSSAPKKHNHGSDCGCPNHTESEARKK